MNGWIRPLEKAFQQWTLPQARHLTLNKYDDDDDDDEDDDDHDDGKAGNEEKYEDDKLIASQHWVRCSMLKKKMVIGKISDVEER